MTELTTVQLTPPYLVLIGDVEDASYAKTGYGLVQWRPELVAGQHRFPACAGDLGVPDMSISEALTAGVKSVIVGVAPVGGVIPKPWWEFLEQAAQAGLDIVCGLHVKLRDNPALVNTAKKSGSRLVDVRIPPPNLPVGTGVRRTGKRVLMVGTDCAVGKKYSALALHIAMIRRGMRSTFRATGQTGIMIAGQGIPIDAVVADFVSGAAEVLSPNNAEDHWDVIEGQGTLFHPGYASVSMGLLHGSQPDGIVICHDASRTHLGEWPDFPVPSISECMDMHLDVGRLTNKDIQCVGISINTSGLDETDRLPYLKTLSEQIGLPCVDPIAQGADAIVDHIHTQFGDTT